MLWWIPHAAALGKLSWSSYTIMFYKSDTLCLPIDIRFHCMQMLNSCVRDVDFNSNHHFTYSIDRPDMTQWWFKLSWRGSLDEHLKSLCGCDIKQKTTQLKGWSTQTEPCEAVRGNMSWDLNYLLLLNLQIVLPAEVQSWFQRKTGYLT